MICTHDEAKTKLCPFRMEMPDANCQVTGCMFWQDQGTRHEEKWFQEGHEDMGFVKYPSRGSREIGSVLNWFYVRDTGIPQGACGIAERDVLVEIP